MAPTIAKLMFAVSPWSPVATSTTASAWRFRPRRRYGDPDRLLYDLDMIGTVRSQITRTFHEHEVFKGASFWAQASRSNAGQDIHAHDFLEVEVIAGGTGYHVTAQGRRPARAGDLYVLRPGTWHGYDDCHGLFIATASVAPSALVGEAAVLRDIPTLRDLLWHRPTAAGNHGVYTASIGADRATEAAGRISALKRDLDERPANQPLLLGQLLTVLGTLAEAVVGDDHERQLHPAVAAVLDELDAAVEKDWRLEELATLVSLDPAYLSRLFRRHVGLPPIGYLARARAERAAALLARTSEPVARIGALVGWPDPAYFTRRFRALFGITPTGYRRRCAVDPRFGVVGEAR